MDLYSYVCTVGLSDLGIEATTSLMETQSGTSRGTEKLSFFPVLLLAQLSLTVCPLSRMNDIWGHFQYSLALF